ncbi:MAG: NIF family HAD-type phosphatase [Cyanobacteria bacterium P01_G01_bin.67]
MSLGISSKRQGYRLENIVMIDDTPRKLEKNYGNLVRVREWLGSTEDRELLLLMKYLTDLKKFKNIRKIEKRGWQSHYSCDTTK